MHSLSSLFLIESGEMIETKLVETEAIKDVGSVVGSGTAPNFQRCASEPSTDR